MSQNQVRQIPNMEFSETSGAWRSVPAWVGFLVRFGYEWPVRAAGTRRIALLSMPCNSAAAGLLALGALVRDLSNPYANDIDVHCNRLIDYAHQYLENCRDCDLPSCDPKIRGCGYLKKVTGIVRSASSPHQTHRVSKKTNLVERRLAFERQAVTTWPNSQYLTEWHIDGEPAAERVALGGELSAEPYLQLVPDASVLPANLRKSFSGLCIAGRSGGKSASRQTCASIRFRNGASEYGLEELLTVHDWSAHNVSRLAFFNTLTGHLDRNVATPRLVIADGDASFLNAIDRQEFREGDIVGAVHRITERDRLEALGNKMSALQQWYVPDEDMLYALPEVPRGISISILRSRT